MTATALNTASSIVPGAAGPAAPGASGKAAQANNPLAGFEALLAALFPQADPTAAGAAAATPGAGAKTAAKAATTDPLTADADKDGKAGKDDAATAAAPADAATAAAVDANAALAASLAATPATAAATEAAPAKAAVDAGLAAAKDDAFPAARAAPGPKVPPGLLAKAEPAADADADADDETATEPPAPGATHPALPDTAKAGDKPAPPAWGRDKPAGQPAAPALANAAAKAAKAAPVEPTAEPTPTETPAPQATPAADAGAAAATTAATTAAVTLAGPAPTPGPAPKPAKVERPKAGREIETLSEATPTQAADKPATARAVTAATAKPAGPETEAADAVGPHAAKAASDTASDTPLAGETHTTAQTAAPAAQAAHAVRGSPETVANLAAQIVKKLEAKSTRFDVELNPQGLGKVNVRVEIGAQGAISAAMSFDNPQAAAELRSRATELQRALEQAGFTLSGAMSFDVAQDRGHQGQPWQHAQQDGGDSGRAFRGQAFQAALDTAGDAANAAVNGALRLRRGVTASVDVRI